MVNVAQTGWPRQVTSWAVHVNSSFDVITRNGCYADFAAVAKSVRFCKFHLKSLNGDIVLRRIGDWLRGVGVAKIADETVLVDPVLGQMDEDHQIKGRLVGHVSFENRNIELSVDPDGEPLEESLNTARTLSKSLISLDKKARSVASRDLLNEYNESWRRYSITSDDGTVKDVENPVLTPEAFEAKILLSSVDVSGKMLIFCYADQGLFAGHSIFVEAFDGLPFKDANATLSG